MDTQGSGAGSFSSVEQGPAVAKPSALRTHVLFREAGSAPQADEHASDPSRLRTGQTAGPASHRAVGTAELLGRGKAVNPHPSTRALKEEPRREAKPRGLSPERWGSGCRPSTWQPRGPGLRPGPACLPERKVGLRPESIVTPRPLAGAKQQNRVAQVRDGNCVSWVSRPVTEAKPLPTGPVTELGPREGRDLT